MTAPLVLLDATIHLSPTRTLRGEVRTDGSLLTHVGPADPRTRPVEARTIDLGGAAVVPLRVDSARRARPRGSRHPEDLEPGNSATFAVTRRAVAGRETRGALMIRPADLLAVVLDGKEVARDGSPVTAPGNPDHARWVGAWADPARGLVQHLRADGRYSETRGGRVDAWTGAWWAGADRVAYLDDTGFWAFGVLEDDVLHHADFVMRRGGDVSASPLPLAAGSGAP